MITRRISGLFDDVTPWFLVSLASIRRRFVLRAGDQFHASLSMEKRAQANVSVSDSTAPA